jgi:hypothetical protein
MIFLVYAPVRGVLRTKRATGLRDWKGRAVLCCGEMTDEQKLIWDWIGMLPVRVFDWNEALPKLYDSLNANWFKNSLPPISDAFVCEFCDMPRETVGISIDAVRAAKISRDGINVRPGIIIALLHEMVHASGIEKHHKAFQNAIAELFAAGAYKDIL